MSKALFGKAIRAARDVREEVGVPLDQPMPDLLRFVEEGAGVPVAVVRLGDGLAGAYVRTPSPVVFVNGDEALVRQRFTLAHELGHHRLGHDSVLDSADAFSVWNRDPREVEANTFASELLAPRAATSAWAERELHGEPTLEDVVRFASAFGISALAGRIRLSSAGVLKDPERSSRLDAEIQESLHTNLSKLLGIEPVHDALERACRQLPRLPETGDNALIAYARGELPLEQLAAMLGRDVASVEQAARTLGLTRAPA